MRKRSNTMKKRNGYSPKRRTNGVKVIVRRRRNPSFSGGTVRRAVGTLAGFVATDVTSNMLPNIGGPIGNIAKKALVAYGLSLLSEKVGPVKPYADDIFVGGLVSATKAAIEFFAPGLGMRIPNFAPALPAPAPVAALPAGNGMNGIINRPSFVPAQRGMNGIISRPAFTR